MTDSNICKSCGKAIDAVASARFENKCHDCFSKVVSKHVHPIDE